MKYLFKTSLTMKDYNNKKWWIDSGTVTEKTIEADSVDAALGQFRTIIWNEHYISISDNAIKNKKPMYIDTRGIVKQIGYVVTGKTEFQSDSDQWVSNYIDLWIGILTVVETEF